MDDIEERIVSLEEAETSLSQLVRDALDGEQIVIAQAGKRLVRLVPVEQPLPAASRRLGLLSHRTDFCVPDAATFNSLGREDIERMSGVRE
ncbi:MAG: type II toxin-antitoxin system prevent-host-death family antitoxin [Alphaproteobacteria bacterium]|nr:type II toxin-antitoxin system prevent-host-death family antitoxin [Alphaproteobacteria bacterium]